MTRPIDFIIRTSVLLIAMLGPATPASGADPGPIPVRVVVVTTFELGDDTGDKPGEFQAWAANLPLPIVIHFPQGYHHLRYNPDLGVLGIVTGQGKSHAAASIMGLGMDPRFDLTHAYWIVAAIAGVDPKKASVASAAWANYVVDGDLAYEIDAREIPYGPPWSTGYVPFGDSTPYALPYPGIQCQRRKSSLSAQHQSGQLGI